MRLRNGESELYDLQTDIGETQDLAAQKPEMAARLRAAYEAWDKDNIAPVFAARIAPAKTPGDADKDANKNQDDE